MFINYLNTLWSYIIHTFIRVAQVRECFSSELWGSLADDWSRQVAPVSARSTARSMPGTYLPLSVTSLPIRQ